MRLLTSLFLSLLSCTPIVSAIAVPATEAATYCRFVPERADDFAWENDKIAFRAYGPALREKAEDSGFDCWLKRVDYPIIDKWYAGNAAGQSYHVDHGEGYDPYKVGASRGCGGLALWIDGEMVSSDVYTAWEILQNDPEQSVFVLTYEWSHAGDSYKEAKQITIKLGERLFHSKSTFWKNGELATDLPIAIGLVMHGKADGISKDLKAGWISYWETLDGDGLGTGVVIDPTRIESFELIESKVKLESHVLVITKTDASGQVEYATGYGWERAGEITTPAQWNDYLATFNK